MLGTFASYCKKQKKRRETKKNQYKRHKDISKKIYLKETLYKAWQFHVALNNLHLSDVNFRKIVYDAIFDALPNSEGKIHNKEFIAEYEKFTQWYDLYYRKQFPDDAGKILDWDIYRASPEYKAFIERIKDIQRTNKRLQISVDNALAYMYAKHQKGFNIAEAYRNLEKKLKLDLIEVAWSKKSLWLATNILVFDAINLYAGTIGNNKTIYRDFEMEKAEAIKIKTIPWYERKDLQVDENLKTMMKIYDNLIIPIVAEIGSVYVADIVRMGTVHSLLHVTRMLTNIAKFHPSLRGLSWGATLTGALADILNNSVLAWLGWQFAVEWQADGFIQYFLQEGAKLVYSMITGKNAWDVTHGKGTSWYGFETMVKLLAKQFFEGFDAREWNLITIYKENCHPKAREVLDRLTSVFQTYQKIYHYAQKYKFQFTRDVKDINDAMQNWIENPNEIYKIFLNRETIEVGEDAINYSNTMTEMLTLELMEFFEKEAREKGEEYRLFTQETADVVMQSIGIANIVAVSRLNDFLSANPKINETIEKSYKGYLGNVYLDESWSISKSKIHDWITLSSWVRIYATHRQTISDKVSISSTAGFEGIPFGFWIYTWLEKAEEYGEWNYPHFLKAFHITDLNPRMAKAKFLALPSEIKIKVKPARPYIVLPEWKYDNLLGDKKLRLKLQNRCFSVKKDIEKIKKYLAVPEGFRYSQWWEAHKQNWLYYVYVVSIDIQDYGTYTLQGTMGYRYIYVVEHKFDTIENRIQWYLNTYIFENVVDWHQKTLQKGTDTEILSEVNNTKTFKDRWTSPVKEILLSLEDIPSPFRRKSKRSKVVCFLSEPII